MIFEKKYEVNFVRDESTLKKKRKFIKKCLRLYGEKLKKNGDVYVYREGWP